jgi:DNA-binding LacI/PurR family transcriptional regulator
VPGSLPERRAQSPTIRDVARHAGVSSATVSRVLNDLPLVTGPTRERVLEAIDELDYRPSTAARGLTSGRWRAVGVVAPFFTSASAVERLGGVAERLAESQYSLVMHDVETLEQRAEALTAFARPDRIDGLLVISLPLADDEHAALEHDEFPIVLLDVSDASHPDLAIDDVHGGRLATEHLLAAGHARIGFVGDAPASPFGFTSSEDRRRGYLRALREAGIEPLMELQQRGPHGRVEAQRLADRLLDLVDPPTAIFAASDMQAVGVMEAVRSRGLRMPDDVAVIGFDDVELAEIVGLTTVRQPLRESGRRGAELLLARLESREPDRRPLTPLAVVERRTA